jgi:hypothetical protein
MQLKNIPTGTLDGTLVGTHVTGTATSTYGTYAVDVTR